MSDDRENPSATVAKTLYPDAASSYVIGPALVVSWLGRFREEAKVFTEEGGLVVNS